MNLNFDLHESILNAITNFYDRINYIIAFPELSSSFKKEFSLYIDDEEYDQKNRENYFKLSMEFDNPSEEDKQKAWDRIAQKQYEIEYLKETFNKIYY